MDAWTEGNEGSYLQFVNSIKKKKNDKGNR